MFRVTLPGKWVVGLIAALVLISLTACEKEPGFGGLASISGKVYAFDYNINGTLVAEGYTGDLEVFIAVDGQPGVLDRIRTSYDGSYRFNQLRKGKYIVWVFSACDQCVDNQEAITKMVEITSNRQKVVLEDFRIRI